MRNRTSSVKPLSADEVNEQDVDVLFLVWLLSRATYDLLDDVLAPAGLTGDEFAIYSMLAAAEHITPSELARWMAAPPTTVSSYVKRLEGRGHVTRVPNPDDRRSYRLRLSPAGRKAHERASEHFRPVRTQVADAIADQSDAIRDTLLRLRGVIEDIQHENTSTELPRPAPPSPST